MFVFLTALSLWFPTFVHADNSIKSIGTERLAICGPAEFLSYTKADDKGSQVTVYYLKSKSGDTFKAKTLYALPFSNPAVPNAKCINRSFRTEELNSAGDFMIITQTCSFLMPGNQKFENEYLFYVFSPEKTLLKKGLCLQK